MNETLENLRKCETKNADQVAQVTAFNKEVTEIVKKYSTMVLAFIQVIGQCNKQEVFSLWLLTKHIRETTWKEC